jgi:uncharacterized protein YndB with AHSA1/START domain
MTTETTIAPVQKALTVNCPVEHAFATFTDRIGEWWPLPTHSTGEARSESVRFEPGLEGRIVERVGDGTEEVWGYVLEWDPPNRVRFSWHPGKDCSRTRVDEATEVEVTFTPDAEGGTRVELVHRGWERLGERGVAARESYHTGWDPVLALYEDAANQPGSISR